MRHRITTALISLATIVGMLHTSALPAAACSCAMLTDDENIRGVMDYYGLVVEGRLGTYSDAADSIRFEPEVLYHGDLPDEIVIDQTWDSGWDGGGGSGSSSLGADCHYILMGEPGDRYVLFLQANPAQVAGTNLGGEEGTYRPAGCASFSIDEMEDGYALAPPEAYEAIKRIAGGGTVVGSPPIEEDNIPTDPPIEAGPVSSEAPTPGEDAVLEQAAPDEGDDNDFTTAMAVGGAGLLAAAFVVGGLVFRNRSG